MGKHASVVVFLGAGFSRAALLPIMSEFGEASRSEHQALRQLRNSRQAAPLFLDAATTFEAFQQVCRRAPTASPMDWNNLERIFSVAEALSQASVGSIDLEGNFVGIDVILRAMKLWTWKIYHRLPIRDKSVRADRDLYEAFITALVARSGPPPAAVITTNYDILYETLSSEHGVRCSYPFSWDPSFSAGIGSDSYLSDQSAEGSTLVCKLHGSINYFEDPSGKADGVSVASARSDGRWRGTPSIPRGLPAVLAVDALAQLKNRCNGDLVPAIIPPTYAKLHELPWLSKTWGAALEAVRHARAILFIGYSMPPSDGFMPAFLSGAMAMRETGTLPWVYVVDPCEEVHERYRKVFSTCVVEQCPMGLAEALDEGVIRTVLDRCAG